MNSIGASTEFETSLCQQLRQAILEAIILAALGPGPESFPRMIHLVRLAKQTSGAAVLGSAALVVHIAPLSSTDDTPNRGASVGLGGEFI